MELTKGQNRFINSKSMGVSFLKGKKGSGKTTASIYRVINLENNYCLFDDDKILYITLDNDRARFIKNKYDENKNENYFYSLFSSSVDKVNIISLPEMILDYSNRYKSEIQLELENVSKEIAIDILDEIEFKNTLLEYSKKSKLIKKLSREEIFDEIAWVKASKLSLDEYMICERRGRKRKIRKSSSSRELLYKLMELYNKLLIENEFMDKYDRTSFATEFSKMQNEKYTHIIVDSTENLTRGELEFIKGLYKKTEYSSLSMVINTDENFVSESWFVKGRKTLFLEEEFKNRTYIFKNSLLSNNIKRVSYMEKYKYINLKYKNEFDFNIDNTSNNKEIYLESNLTFKTEELKEIPVFNEIAAGNPIEINEEVKDSFYLPINWIEKGKDTFILEVKGDSMIDKNICNGDMVVIKKQPIAYNNDIVAAALDGEATLKILNTNDKEPKLMPANSKYSPINLVNKEVSILGVAIGIIKYQN